jgi:hypothetical protein
MVVSKSSFRVLVKSLPGLCTNGIGQAAISRIFSNNTLFTLSEKFMGETSKNVFIQGASPHFFCACQPFFAFL